MTDTSAPKQPRPWTPRRIVGAGCGAVTALILLFFMVAGATLLSKWNEPFNTADEIAGLAGVPPYPGATIDEEATRLARATAATLRGLYPADSTTAVGLRTNDDPATKVIPFYDAVLARFGFTKTRLGGGAGDAGASYAGTGCTVVIQTRDDPGEDRQLFVMRFDTGAKKMLGKRTDVVTPEDFKTPKK